METEDLEEEVRKSKEMLNDESEKGGGHAPPPSAS